MVVFENGAFVKNSYRKFNIVCENNITNDDYFMMDQVMNRRFKNFDGWKKKLPQLILIDGGLGQLNIVKNISLCNYFQQNASRKTKSIYFYLYYQLINQIN